MGNQVDVEDGKWWEGKERRNFVLFHAISTNGLEDLFPQSRASPSG